MTDLWPKDMGYAGELKAPITILREQASLLGRKTRNLVEAEVRQRGGHEQQFAYEFNIVAPTLGPYRYLLFWIRHGIDLYPVQIMIDGDMARQISGGSPKLGAQSEEEFLGHLERILNAGKTRRVIQALLAQVSGAPAPEFDKEGIEPVRTLTEAPPSLISG
jgi:hypothetical protein